MMANNYLAINTKSDYPRKSKSSQKSFNITFIPSENGVRWRRSS